MKLLMRIITKPALNWLDCIDNNTTFNKKLVLNWYYQEFLTNLVISWSNNVTFLETFFETGNLFWKLETFLETFLKTANLFWKLETFFGNFFENWKFFAIFLKLLQLIIQKMLNIG